MLRFSSSLPSFFLEDFGCLLACKHDFLSAICKRKCRPVDDESGEV